MESRRRHLSSGDLETTSTVDFCPQVTTVLVFGDSVLQLDEDFVESTTKPGILFRIIFRSRTSLEG